MFSHVGVTNIIEIYQRCQKLYVTELKEYEGTKWS